jgi:integrase
MSPNVRKNRSAKYPYIFKYPTRSRFWVYRRFSEEKGKEFSFSTGEEKNEKLADDIGGKAYQEWLGVDANSNGEVTPLFKAYAQAHLDRKLERPLSDFSKNSRYTSKSSTAHLINAFGHLRLDQVDEDVWDSECNRLSADGDPPKFFNRRKELNEILARAHRNGLIRRLPKFRNPDVATETGRALKDWEVAALVAVSSPDFGLYLETLWRQGARPREVLQYEWSMVDWSEGEHGVISIPAGLTKTRRARTIPLHSVISAQFKARLKQSKSAYIFPSPDAQKGGDFPMVDYRHAWEGALERAQKTAKEATPPRQIAHCVIYDLRRTFITNCAKRGKPILWVARYTDTSVKMIEKFYAKTQHDVLQEVIE